MDAIKTVHIILLYIVHRRFIALLSMLIGSKYTSNLDVESIFQILIITYGYSYTEK